MMTAQKKSISSIMLLHCRVERLPDNSPSPTGREVLHYLIRAKARKEIAAAMNLSEDTVRGFLRSLYEKLGVTSRVKAATLGLRMALVENLKSVL